MEQNTQNLFISTNWSTALLDYKRGILAEDDEYRIRERKEEEDE